MNEESVRNHQELVKHFEVIGDQSLWQNLIKSIEKFNHFSQKSCKSPPSKRNSIDLAENEKDNNLMLSNLSAKIDQILSEVQCIEQNRQDLIQSVEKLNQKEKSLTPSRRKSSSNNDLAENSNLSLIDPALISNLDAKIDQIEKNQQLSSQFVSELIKNLNDKIGKKHALKEYDQFALVNSSCFCESCLSNINLAFFIIIAVEAKIVYNN